MGRTRLRGLSIAGIQIGVEVPDHCEWEWPEDGIDAFECLPRDPEVHVGLRVAELSQADLGGARYPIGASTFEVARRGDDWLIGLTRAGRRRQLALFSDDFRVGEVVQSPDWAEQRRSPLAGGLDEWIVLQRTVARGGLCLTGRALASSGGARILLGAGEIAPTRRWRIAAPSLLGRQTLVLREESAALRIFRTPWCGEMDEALGGDARVLELCCQDESTSAYRELLDPDDAAEQLVGHAVLPLDDERFLDRVLRNARRICEQGRVVRVGVPEVGERVPARPAAGLAHLLTPLFGVF
ncbi:hypothetical protein K2X89_01525 [Myxococcota bacterium]|nr:hypothetical protein [Myxococcota bacterium]